MPDWKRYPYTPEWNDSRQFTFPQCDGFRPELGISTYFIDGFLQGVHSDRRYAFMSIFADMRPLRKRVRASFYTFALFDCDRGHYGTFTDFDFPRPPLVRSQYKLDLTSGRLGLKYRSSAGEARWDSVLASAELFRPFAWELDLVGRDHHGAAMRLELAVEAMRPPAPLGGDLLGGEMMFLGAERTYSYFQSGLRLHGKLTWGDVSEEVEGDIGWIDRQWAGDHFTKHQDFAVGRYRSEWRVMQFNNGWDMSCFHQYLRPQRNAVVPWTGISAQGPAPEFKLAATHRVELSIPEFIRSPGTVRSQQMLTEGPRYFPYRYRLRVPEWQMDVESEPLIETPAHSLPIEYWTGPVVMRGSLFDQPVAGVGFDERSRPWTRDFELARALRLTVDHIDDVEADLARALSYRAWEVEAICLRGTRHDAAAHYRRAIEPLLSRLPEAARAKVETLAVDLASLL